MSKIRKLLIALLSVCMTLCAGFAIAACNNNNPNVINPDEDAEFTGKYVVTVQSRGGLSLNNVKISVQKDNNVLYEGTSVDGKIPFTLTPDEYDIVVDESSLPAGYYSASDEEIKTSADNGDVSISFDSKVITSAAPSNTLYNKGDVMYDFSFEDAASGTVYSLADTLSKKRAVMINFWGTTCIPCVSEFPAIKEAYESYQDNIEIFALSSYNNDTNEEVVKFKNDYDISFPVSLDTTGLSQFFRMGQTVNGETRGWPTTVIVDRYGVIAYVRSGSNASASAWKALFNKYTSPDYSQSIDISTGTDTEIVFEERPENIEIPDAAAIAEAINTSSAQGRVNNFAYAEEDPLAWPWTLDKESGGNSYLTAPIADVKAAYAVVYFEIDLKPLEGISFNYNVNTLSEYNILYLIIDGIVYWECSGTSNGWQEYKLKDTTGELYYARSTRTVRATLMYMKQDDVEGSATVAIDDIKIYNVAEESGIKDFAISVVDSATLNSKTGKYDDVVIEYNQEDNLYYTYYTGDDNVQHKSLLVADVNKITAWTDIHYGKYFFNATDKDNNETTQSASLYGFSWWLMSNFKVADNQTIPTKINFDPENIIFLTYTLQQFSDTGYVPVTAKLKDILVKFTLEAYKDDYRDVFNFEDSWYEDQWLELCYYFRHYGEQHSKDEVCFEQYKGVEGLSFEYAMQFSMNGEDSTTQEINITKVINYWTSDDMREAGGGLKYKFTPDQDGVYLFTTDSSKDANASPLIRIVDFTTGQMYENDKDPRYNHIYDNNEVYLLVEMVAGREYGITAAMYQSTITGKYDLNVEYVGTYAELVRACTSGAGFWTWKEDENGNPVTDATGQILFYYVGVKAVVDPTDHIYYMVIDDEEFGQSYGATIYIDFIYPNYFDYNTQHTLYEMIYGYDYEVEVTDENGNPVLGEDGKVLTEIKHNNGWCGEYTDIMKTYYEKSIAGKSKDDWNYGLTEATEELVVILSNLIGERVETDDWQQFACYKETYGTK